MTKAFIDIDVGDAAKHADLNAGYQRAVSWLANVGPQVRHCTALNAIYRCRPLGASYPASHIMRLLHQLMTPASSMVHS